MMTATPSNMTRRLVVDVGASIERGLMALVSALWRSRAEWCTATAMLGGWLSLTWAIAPIAPRVVWPVSVALLLWSLCGWRLLWTVARDGLYALTQDERAALTRGGGR